MGMTAIIANRGELPENLRRTRESLARQGVEATVVDDTAPHMGCGYRRHEGILRADAERVFLCDGHMDFEPGFFEAIERELDAHPHTVVCGRMISLRHDWTPQGAPYSAGVICRKVEQALGEPVPFHVRWREGFRKPGITGGVMGACYAFTRELYDRMGRPLEILQAWGGDEELLSLGAWLVGDGCRMVDATARHIYAAPRLDGRVATERDLLGVWANRRAIIDALPMPEAERAELLDYMRINAWYAPRMDAIMRRSDRVRDQCERVRDALGSGGRSWEDIMGEIIGKPAPKKGRTSKTKRAATKRPKKVVASKAETTTTTTAMRRPRANYGSAENRRRCHSCGSGDSDVTSVRHVGRMTIRYRRCLDCGRRRVTQEFLATP
jgi:hypothetical protein